MCIYKHQCCCSSDFGVNISRTLDEQFLMSKKKKSKLVSVIKGQLKGKNVFLTLYITSPVILCLYLTIWTKKRQLFIYFLTKINQNLIKS